MEQPKDPPNHTKMVYCSSNMKLLCGSLMLESCHCVWPVFTKTLEFLLEKLFLAHGMFGTKHPPIKGLHGKNTSSIGGSMTYESAFFRPVLCPVVTLTAKLPERNHSSAHLHHWAMDHHHYHHQQQQHQYGQPKTKPTIWEWFIAPIKFVILGMVHDWVYRRNYSLLRVMIVHDIFFLPRRFVWKPWENQVKMRIDWGISENQEIPMKNRNNK